MSREVGSRTVYVIGSLENPVKIGIADRVKRRLAELQTGHPDLLVVHHQVKVPWDLAEKIEAAAHAELMDRHRFGEWFNVHKDEAAEVVDRLKVKLLLERQKWARRNGDLIDSLQAEYELSTEARDAACEYRDKLDARSEEYVTYANGYVLKSCGMAAYAAFSIVIAQRKPLSGLEGRDLQKARLALVKALNALADFDQLYRELRADRDWERKWAAHYRGLNVTAPGSTLARLRREAA